MRAAQAFWLFAALLVSLLSLFTPCRAADAPSARELARIVSTGRPEELQALAERDFPVGELNSYLAQFGGAQFYAARRLGDVVLIERVLRRWVAALPSDPWARTALWRFLAEAGHVRLDEVLAMGRERVKEGQLPQETLYWGAMHAGDLLTAWQIEAAAQTLSRLDQLVVGEFAFQRPGGSAPFYKALALGEYHIAKCRLAAAQRQHAEVNPTCRRGVDSLAAAQRYSGMVSATEQGDGMTRLALAYAHWTALLSAQGATFDALQLLAEGREKSKALPGERLIELLLAYQDGVIRLREGHFGEALLLSEDLLKQASRAGFGSGTRAALSVRALRQRALLGLGQYADVVADLTLQDQLRESGRPLPHSNTRLRLTAYLSAGRGAEVAELADRYVDDGIRLYGEQDAEVWGRRGLRALTWQAEGGRRSAEAVTELTAAARALMASNDGAVTQADPEFALARRLSLSAFLDTLSDVASDSDKALGFQVAEHLRSGPTQTAVVAAARRHAMRTPELMDLVRDEQDAASELASLHALIDELVLNGGPIESSSDVLSKARDRAAAAHIRLLAARLNLQTRAPAFDRLTARSPVDSAAIAKALLTGEAFVSMYLSGRGTYRWVIRPQGLTYHYSEAPRARVDAWVNAVRASVDIDRQPAGLSPFAVGAAKGLFDAAVGEESVKGTTHLILAPAGKLTHVPFAALVIGGTSSAPEWLAQKTAVSQVPGASSWLAIRQLERKSANMMLAGWGDPSFSADAPAVAGSVRRVLTDTRNGSIRYGELPPLPETRDELRAIAASLRQPGDAKLFLGRSATRQSVIEANESARLREAGVLAFATHGLKAGDLPNLNQPALALAATPDAETNPLSPLLTLDDVLGLRLNADWVVLSACNTAAADGRAEEALSGLARGFFYAGARSVLVTHWAVETESAKLLTTRTFEHYTGNTSAGKAESLRQAMLKVMAMPQYAHPAYWAPFALVGDGG